MHSVREPASRNADDLCPTVVSCAGNLVYVTGTGYSSTTCYYNQTTGALLAAKSCSDTNEYCGGRAFCNYGGNDLGDCVAPIDITPTSFCPPTDGGSDATSG